ncbi:MAG: chemotaxis protein CheA [Lachnospiraceae bacterium]|nr:chemotaxis protein CheA [Lachnospiraceae bacterium]
MDVGQYLGIFLDESQEHIQALNDNLLTLEQDPENEDSINEIFRAAHSLKGMAGTMGYKRLQKLTHVTEDVFSAIRGGQMKVASNLIDILFQALDAIQGYVDTIRDTSDEGEDDNESIIAELNKILQGGEAGGDAAPAAEAAATAAVEAPAAEAAPAAASEADDKALYKKVVLEEAQRDVMKDAVVAEKQVYGFTVFVDPNCMLKAARAFLVFKAVEETGGEIIVSDPSSQDIEDEKFDLSFSIFVITSAPIDQVIASMKSVSEIVDVVGEAYDEVMIDANGTGAPAAAPAAEAAPAPAAEAAPAPAAEAAPAPEAAKPAAAQSGVSKKSAPPKKPVASQTVRVDIEKLDNLMNLVSELIIAKNSLVSSAAQMSGGSNSESQAIAENVEYLESVTTNLHESVMKVRMVPIESALQKFPRMIRDLEKKLGKRMQLTITGEETELDRTVVDQIGDPLMHLLRNSADHGLETPDVRSERGKPETGSIFLNAYQEGNNVIIEVGDDGNGVDVEAVRAKIIERGFLPEEQALQMNDKEVIDVLFDPGFSMAKQVTDISGRGVGLDVVKSNIEQLGGDVEVKTKLGEGSTFIVRLPLTLAIIQALMVLVGGEKYAIALGNIQTIEDIPISEIRLVENKEVIQLRGSVIPIIRLSDVLDAPEVERTNENLIIVVVKKGDSLAGLVVDELMGQQEIVIKSLGKYINTTRIISGATILGDGEVALIIDSNALF